MDAKRFTKLSLALFLLLIIALACNFSSSTQSNVEATAQALGESVLQTATAAASGEISSDESVATAQVEATEQSIANVATQTAEAIIDEEGAAATAQVVEPIRAELPKYGVDPNQGELAWIHPPEVLELEGYQQFDYANQFLGTVAKDFVVSADITWNTDFGTSGCGFVLRSDGDQEAPNQYMSLATRGSSGHVIFATVVDGEIVTGRDIYAYGLDPNFDWRNDTTNRLTIVGQGNEFFVYTNDTLIGEIDPSAPPPQPYIPPPPEEPADVSDAAAVEKFQKEKQEYDEVVKQIRADHSARVSSFEPEETIFEKGFIAFVAASESGTTTCKFDNAWLWLIN
jgi:hypothetical protein